jgi:hypothetical protein
MWMSLLSLGFVFVVYCAILLAILLGSRILLRFSAIRSFVLLISAAPLIAVLAVLMLAFVYGGLGAGYGIAKLFWHEDKLSQFFAGVAVSVLFGEFWFVAVLIAPQGREILDRTHPLVDRLLRRGGGPACEPPTLEYTAVRFLLLTCLISLFLLTVPAIFLAARPRWPRVDWNKIAEADAAIWPWLAGLIVGAMIAITCAWGVIRLVTWLRERAADPARPVLSLARWNFVARRGTAATGTGQATDTAEVQKAAEAAQQARAAARSADAGSPSHTKDMVRLWFLVVLALFMLCALVPINYNPIPPAVAICLLFGLIAAVYAVVSVANPTLQVPALVILLLVVLLINGLSFRGKGYDKLQFASFDEIDGTRKASYYDGPQPLNTDRLVENYETELLFERALVPVNLFADATAAAPHGALLPLVAAFASLPERVDWLSSHPALTDDPTKIPDHNVSPICPPGHALEVLNSGRDIQLLDNQAVLWAWRAYCRRVAEQRAREKPGAYPPLPDWKPKLVVVTTSGGASLASVWTAVVLTQLEKDFERHDLDFPAHVRLITGASGGMLGAGYYVATLGPPSATEVNGPGAPRTAQQLSDIVRGLAADSLSPVVRKLVFRDCPTLLCPERRRSDRGRVLEETWWHNTRGYDGATEPPKSRLAWPFRHLAPGEAAGWRPSLVFSPMMVEDGRRLLISNLDLFPLARNHSRAIIGVGASPSASPLDPFTGGTFTISEYFSLSAVELFRVFPRLHNFQLSTAARMSATFPYVSPAVHIPTTPVRRIVDAGYYDNYGVNLAASWIIEHRRWIREHTSGVVLIQIRAFAQEARRRQFDPAGAAHPVTTGAQWLTTPVAGLLSSRQSVMAYRNDEQIERLQVEFAPETEKWQRPFITTLVFEAPRDVSMSWYLTQRETRLLQFAMAADAESEGLREKLQLVATREGEGEKTPEQIRQDNRQKLNGLIDWWRK